MKSNNKRNSGLLYQKVLKKAPLYEPMMIRERRYMPKRIYQPIEVPNFTSQPPLKPMDPRVETSWSPEEVVVDKNSRAGNDLIIQENPLQELPKFEMPEFKPLRGKAKRQFKRENIQRVADKYGITRGQARRGLRKMRRAGEDYIPQEYLSSLKMVKRNSAVPFKLPHQSNSALPNVELSQAVKDSLHNQANLYGKPFFSPKHGVNVDPEDGVLSNRPIYSDNTKLTYDKINKPFSPVNIKEEAYEKQNRKMRADHKKDTGKTLGERQTSGTGSRRVSFACRFGGMAGDMTDDDGSPSKLAMALKKWGFSSKGEAKAFCSKNKES